MTNEVCFEMAGRLCSPVVGAILGKNDSWMGIGGVYAIIPNALGTGDHAFDIERLLLTPVKVHS
jgi:hypothetical protein